MITKEVLLSVILCALVILIIIRTLTSMKKKPSFIDVGLLMCTFVVVILIIMTRAKFCPLTKNKTTLSPEHFLDPMPEPENITNSLDRILSIIGVQNSSAPNTSSIAQDVANTSGTYNEKLYPIENGLTLYYSVFSQSSQPNNNNTWYNISTFFSTPQASCPDVKYDETHMHFFQPPTFSKENGFSLGKNYIVGPKCFQLGINGNSSFSMFITLRLESFSELTDNPNDYYQILKLYANTQTNNGIDLFLTNIQATPNTSGFNATVNLGFGSDSRATPEPIFINKDNIYLFVITKSNNLVNLSVYPNVNNIAINYQNKIRLITDWPINPNEDVLFSNKNLVINRNRNIFMSVYNFGVYNKSLNDTSMGMLFNHIQTEIQKNNALLKQLASQINNLQSQADLVKACPYDKFVCTKCDDIKDWTNMTNVILNGSTECLGSIDAFCTNPSNHNNALCACWNTKNSMSSTMQCKNYVNIFRGNNLVDVESIDRDSLNDIKDKYDLCSCKGLEELKRLLKEKDDIISKRQILPKPKLLDNVYRIDKQDIVAYNSIPIENTYEPTIPSGRQSDGRYELTDPFEKNNQIKEDDEDAGVINWLSKKLFS